MKGAQRTKLGLWIEQGLIDAIAHGRNYPAWICSPCGQKWGRRECGLATWHPDECGICGEHTVVTEPRDFGGLKDGWRGKQNAADV